MKGEMMTKQEEQDFLNDILEMAKMQGGISQMGEIHVTANGNGMGEMKISGPFPIVVAMTLRLIDRVFFLSDKDVPEDLRIPMKLAFAECLKGRVVEHLEPERS